MLIWLIKDGETLPIQPGTRAMRTGMLADELLARGHSVVWWSSTFSHPMKSLLHDRDAEIVIKPGLHLRLLHAGSYKRNISLERRRHHRLLARRFREAAASATAPDAIVCAFPIIDVACEAVRYGEGQEVPVVLDIRDLWPDTLVEKMPRGLRAPVRAMLRSEYRKTALALRGADSIVSISNGCLRWGLRFANRSQTEWDRVFFTSYPEPGEADTEPSARLSDLMTWANGKVLFTFVGTFGHSYQLQLVCDVAERALTKQVGEAVFALAGTGQQFGKLSRRAKSLSNMRLTGWLDRDDLTYLLRHSHVGLLPCDHVEDAMPNKAFEYMSMGLPIVSSLVGEFEQFLADNEAGFSYRCGDVERLFSHVAILARDPNLRRKLAANSRSAFERNFRPRTIYGEYAEHIERIASEKPADRGQEVKGRE
jgi:glycosyltransferase involved in cell wall biosynthesis